MPAPVTRARRSRLRTPWAAASLTSRSVMPSHMQTITAGSSTGVHRSCANESHFQLAVKTILGRETATPSQHLIEVTKDFSGLIQRKHHRHGECGLGAVTCAAGRCEGRRRPDHAQRLAIEHLMTTAAADPRSACQPAIRPQQQGDHRGALEPEPASGAGIATPADHSAANGCTPGAHIRSCGGRWWRHGVDGCGAGGHVGHGLRRHGRRWRWRPGFDCWRRDRLLGCRDLHRGRPCAARATPGAPDRRRRNGPGLSTRRWLRPLVDRRGWDGRRWLWP